MTVAESVDGTKIAWDQAMAEAWSANVKAMFEQHLRDGEREREQKNLSDALAQRVAEQQNALVALVAGITAVTTATADATEAWAGYDAAMHTTAGQMEETATAAHRSQNRRARPRQQR